MIIFRYRLRRMERTRRQRIRRMERIRRQRLIRRYGWIGRFLR